MPASLALKRKRLFKHLESRDMRREDGLRHRSAVNAVMDAVLHRNELPVHPVMAAVSRLIPLDPIADAQDEEVDADAAETEIDVRPRYSSPAPPSPMPDDDSNAGDFNFGDAH